MFKRINYFPVNIKQFEDKKLTIEDVKKFLADNKDQADVKTYLGELSALTAERVEGFLDTPEGRKLLQPRLDTNFTKGLNTWKEKNLDKLVDEEVKKRNPDKTTEQLELEKLRKEIEDERKARNRETLVNKALKLADEKKLPKDIVDYFIADDEEKTVANLTKLEEVYGKAVQAAVDEKFKQSGRLIDQSTGGSNIGGIDVSKLAAEASIRK